MVNAKEHLGLTSFIGLDDVDNGPIRCEVEDVEVGDTAFAENALIVRMVGRKLLVLNKTRGAQMIRLFGDETDNWVGKEVELFKGEIRGRECVCVREVTETPF